MNFLVEHLQGTLKTILCGFLKCWNFIVSQNAGIFWRWLLRYLLQTWPLFRQFKLNFLWHFIFLRGAEFFASLLDYFSYSFGLKNLLKTTNQDIWGRKSKFKIFLVHIKLTVSLTFRIKPFLWPCIHLLTSFIWNRRRSTTGTR